jgi:HSP20 family protein
MAQERERSLARLDPFEDLDLFRDWRPFPSRLGRMLDELWGERGIRGGRLLPAIDVAEDDDQYVVTVEVPGIRREDVTVELRDNILTIRGEKKSEREGKKEQARWAERSYGTFSRSFTLPSNCDPDQVKASFKDGILTIEIRKAEEAKPRVISIK